MCTTKNKRNETKKNDLGRNSQNARIQSPRIHQPEMGSLLKCHKSCRVHVASYVYNGTAMYRTHGGNLGTTRRLSQASLLLSTRPHPIPPQLAGVSLTQEGYQTRHEATQFHETLLELPWTCH